MGEVVSHVGCGGTWLLGSFCKIYDSFIRNMSKYVFFGGAQVYVFFVKIGCQSGGHSSR